MNQEFNNNPEHNEIPQPANAENSHESPEIDEIQAMQGEEVKDLVEGADDLPRANENNELIIDGKKYLTISVLGKLETIDASGQTIEKIIRENCWSRLLASDCIYYNKCCLLRESSVCYKRKSCIYFPRRKYI